MRSSIPCYGASHVHTSGSEIGLGLALASAVAHLHGGTIRLSDNAPGLAIVMSLPIVPPPVDRPVTEAPQGSTSQPDAAGFQSA